MFVTPPAAESPFRLSEDRVWLWMEIELNVPLFVVCIEQAIEEGVIQRTFMTAFRDHVLNWTQSGDDKIRVVTVDLFTPGYVNGTDSYQLHRLKQLWINPQTNEQRYVLLDGTTMHHPSGHNSGKRSAWELVLEC